MSVIEYPTMLFNVRFRKESVHEIGLTLASHGRRGQKRSLTRKRVRQKTDDGWKG